MKYCIDCGFVGVPKQNTPGTLSMEVAVWLVSVVLGAVSSLWRRWARYQGCAQCGSKHIVTTDSRVALAAFRRPTPAPGVRPWACLACGRLVFTWGPFCKRCLTPGSSASEEAGLVRI